MRGFERVWKARSRRSAKAEMLKKEKGATKASLFSVTSTFHSGLMRLKSSMSIGLPKRLTVVPFLGRPIFDPLESA